MKIITGEPTQTEKDTAATAGDFEPSGRIEHGVFLMIRYTPWYEAVLHGARVVGPSATLTRYTAAGATERAAELRWQTHIALRTAAVGGQVFELARVLRQQFGRQAASGGKEALFWPGRAETRQSITAEVRARREAEEAANGGGAAGAECGHDKHACPCDPKRVRADYDLMSSGRDDAVVVHRQEHPHTLVRAWAFLEHWRLEIRLLAEHEAREAARLELEPVPF